MLVSFLNELLKGQKIIKNLSYAKNEHLGKTEDYRKAVFDLYCESSTGEKFIIELQKVKQQFFKDRSIYYATFPIQEQALKGDAWSYQLKEIYTIGIMDIAFDNTHPEQFKHEVKLIDTQTKEVFYEKLTFIYLEMPKFNKKETELTTPFDKWMYLLKNLNRFSNIPPVLQERIFKKVFEIAEVANLNEDEMKRYESSLKDKWDWKNALDTATEEAKAVGKEMGIEIGRQEGIKEGIKEGERRRAMEIAKQMKEKTMPLEMISEITGLTIAEIEKL